MPALATASTGQRERVRPLSSDDPDDDAPADSIASSPEPRLSDAQPPPKPAAFIDVFVDDFIAVRETSTACARCVAHSCAIDPESSRRHVTSRQIQGAPLAV
jgi:hypothetical protein